MNQSTQSIIPKSNLKWLLIALAIVIVGGGLYYYFGIFKGSKTTVTTSPTPGTSVSPSSNTTKSSTPSGGQSPKTANPNLTSFSFDPGDSRWPSKINITFDTLGKTFNVDTHSLIEGNIKLVEFSGDYGYTFNADAMTRASNDASGNQKNEWISSYENPTSTTIDGIEAAQYRWARGSTNGISVIVNVYKEDQKALKITADLSGISESDFNKILQSVKIQK